jgi:hypothetical protein
MFFVISVKFVVNTVYNCMCLDCMGLCLYPHDCMGLCLYPQDYGTVYVSTGLYGTVSVSTGLYPTLDLWNVNKLHYIANVFSI